MKFSTQVTLLALAVATASAKETPSARIGIRGVKHSLDFTEQRQLKKDQKGNKDAKKKGGKEEKKEAKKSSSPEEIIAQARSGAQTDAHVCQAFTEEESEIGELLDTAVPKVEKCTLKRTKYLLHYELDFPKDRPDVYIEIEIKESGTRYQFYPADYADWTAATYKSKGYEYKAPKNGGGTVPTALPPFTPENTAVHDAMVRVQYDNGGQGILFRFVSKIGPGEWNSCKYSPIAFDLDHSGDVGMISKPGGFEIDITGDDDKEHLSQWFAPTEGILIDKKAEEGLEDFKNGIITGDHMMGDMAGEYTDGFAKLATYDDNCDDKLTGEELDGLYIWIDKNSNTLLDEGELHTLKDYGIKEISTVHNDLKSHAVLENGSTMLMQDLWFDTFDPTTEKSGPKKQKTVTICVGTSDAADPFHMITIAEKDVIAHMGAKGKGKGKTYDDCYPGDDVTIDGVKYKVTDDCSLPGYDGKDKTGPGKDKSSSDEGPAPASSSEEGTAPASPSSSDEGGSKAPPAPGPGPAPVSPSSSDEGGSQAPPAPGPAPAPSSDEVSAPGPAPPAPDGPSAEDRTTEKAFTKGDPHFKTFGGEMYDYHGECDLVLLHNPDFKNGMGMDIHIRTKIEDFWSSVESAAIKLGDQTMEIKADPESNEWLWFNGKEASSELVDGEWNRQMMSGFLVRYKQAGAVREANIYLKGAKEYLVIKTFKSFVRVDINWQGSENYYNSVGLLGSHAHNGERLGRDGKFIKNANAFGQEWQVRPEIDGSLFHSYEGAIVGKQCVMPPAYHEGDDLTVASLRGRRLGASALDTQAAEKACDHLVDPEEKKACVFDVIATQDLSMASTW